MIEITLSDLICNPSLYASAVHDKNEKVVLVIGDRQLILMSMFDFSMMKTILDIAASVFDENYAPNSPSNH